MSADELAWLSIAEIGRRYRAGTLTPPELVEALLARIDRLDPKLNAFIHVARAEALGEAHKAAAELKAGRDRGPMHGVPYALKDIVDVKGMATTCHSKILADHVAKQDADVVKRLRTAGAIMLGKVALHEFATGGPTHDLPWPPARNPWNPDVHPGGSSSGSGTAVAAGFAPGAIGTDTGGSIRNPSCCCGLVGLKPTYDFVSRDGVFPLSWSLDHVGPMTRTVEDNALMLEAMVPGSFFDATLRRRRRPDLVKDLRSGVKGLRIGLLEHFYKEDVPADPRQVAAIEGAARVLQAQGAIVESAKLPSLDEWIACGQKIQGVEQHAVHAAWLRDRPQDYAPVSRSKLSSGANVTAAEYAAATEQRMKLREALAAALQKYDALITLSGHELPVRFDDPDIYAKYARHGRMPFNLAGNPALAIPTGFTPEGLPLGMQIAGRPYDEGMLYRIAWAYGEATRWSERRPSLQA